MANMNYRNQWMAFLMAFSLLLTWGCKDDTGTDDDDEVVPGQAIAGTWSVGEDGSVTGPTADQFEDFQLTITALASRVTYSALGNGNKIVFPDAGTLEVESRDNFSAGAEVIRQPDLLPMNMTLNESDTTLRIEFRISADSYAPDNNSRVMGIEGDYVFNLKKQSQ